MIICFISGSTDMKQVDARNAVNIEYGMISISFRIQCLLLVKEDVMVLYKISNTVEEGMKILSQKEGKEKIIENAKRIEFSGKDRRLSEGVFLIIAPLEIETGELCGAGNDKTVIVADFDDAELPMIYDGGTNKLADLSLEYREGLITGNEKSRQRVAIYTTKYWQLQKGACVRNVSIRNVGTGILSARRKNPTDPGCTAFSVMFDNITITDFSYRGFDFVSPVRTGNIYRNINISSGKFICDSAFYFGYEDHIAEESESDITSLKIYDTIAKCPLVLGGARALVADEITLDNVKTLDKDFIIWSKSSGSIEKLIIKNSKFIPNGNLFKIGSTEFVSMNTLNYLRIGTLDLENIDNLQDGFKLFDRCEEYSDDFFVKVENYCYSSETSGKILDKFPVSNRIIFLQKGDISYRPCKFYSKISDASGNVKTFTGEQWN